MRVVGLLWLAGCLPPDMDGDGSLIPADCDDANAKVHPGAGETCGNGVDDDCDETAVGCGPDGQVATSQAAAQIRGAGGWREGLAIRSMLGPGDIDGDGVADVVVGAPGDYRERGAVYVIAGPIEGEVDLAEREITYRGEHNVGVGLRLASGDITGDGTTDLVMGAGPDHRKRGHIFFLEGPVATPSADPVMDVSFEGYGAHDIVVSPDINGDDVGDILITGPTMFVPDQRGAAWILPGGTTGKKILIDVAFSVIGAEVDEGRDGFSVATGDINGDGQADMLVGGAQPLGGGVTYVVLGPITEAGSLADADVVIDGSSGAYVGGQLSSVDADRDGYDDVLATGYGGNDYDFHGGGEPAIAWILSGPMTKGAWMGSARTTFVGGPAVEGEYGLESATFGGDVDLDGKEDVLLGFRDAYWAAGCTVLVRGLPTGTVDVSAEQTVIVGEEEGAGGDAAIGLGDVNADGFGDLLIGGLDSHRDGGIVSLMLGGPGF